MASQITQFFCILVRRNAPELRQIVIAFFCRVVHFFSVRFIFAVFLSRHATIVRLR